MTELFRNTLGPVAWTLIGLVPLAIFALYFLRLRREPVEVPSTYLWTKVIEDLHVNSLWQKLRRNLLLVLQLLLVGLAILALLRPGWQGETLEGRRFIFLIDRSASMATLDADGVSRLDAAKRRVAALVQQLDSDMSAMIIAFDDEPDVVQEFTGNRRLLRDAAARIGPTNKPTNIRGALQLAAGFANPGREPSGDENAAAEDSATRRDAPQPVDLYIFSDGRFPPIDDFSLGNLRPKYLPIGSFDTNNLAITSFNTRRNELRPEQRQAFLQVANFGGDRAPVTARLFLDGRLINAAELTIPPGDVAGATFNLGAAEGRIEARLEAPAQFEDRLSLDDRAFAVLDRQRQARVLLVTPGNRSLELGLSTARVLREGTVDKVAPAAIGSPEFLRDLQAAAYDLVIFDQCAPERPADMPAANTLFIGRMPPLDAWRAGSSPTPAAAPQIIDWERSHPLLNLVELGNVAIVDSLIVAPPPGGKVLVDSNKGPLMAIAPRDSFEDAVMGFEIVGRDAAGATTVNTNWPRRHSFPNFCLNVMQYLAGGGGDVLTANHRPGESVEIELGQRRADLSVVLPDKSIREVEAPAAGKLAFHETDQLGVYDVMSGEQLVARFAVNLFDRQESDVRLRARQDGAGVRTVESVSLGYVDVAAQSPSMPVRKELWTGLLLAALVVLVLEWYIYNRRVFI